ncbi:MAG: hypothetical protein Q7J84_08050 [Sulfuricaulis sp.]|nr:hypothetical protein [Sulfuricaulis sp.]
MALSRLTTWTSGQVLTAAALNDEVNNILNNPGSLICTTAAPAVGSLLVGRGVVTLGVLTVGSNDQVLTADSAQALGCKWAAVAAGGAPGFDTITGATNTGAAMVVGSGASLVPTGTGILRATDLIFGSDAQGDIAVRGASVYGRVAMVTKGNLLAGTGTTAAALAVGTNDQVLTVDSTQATGLKYAAQTLAITSGTATVATSETTTSTSYTDLATGGPAVTLTVGSSGKVLVTVSAEMGSGTAINVYMDFGLTSGNTRSASDTTAVHNFEDSRRASSMTLLTGLAAGSTIFTAKYRVTAGTGTFLNRSISVVAL